MLSQLIKYFKTRKKWWLLPLLFIIAAAAILIAVGPSNPYAPFIYSVF